MLQLMFFARIKEELGCGELQVPWTSDVASLDALQEALCQERGDSWRVVLEQDNMIRAVNHTVVEGDCALSDGDEVAFFPPVTGG